MAFTKILEQYESKIENMTSAGMNEDYDTNIELKEDGIVEKKFEGSFLHVYVQDNVSNAENSKNLEDPHLLNKACASREITLRSEFDLDIKTEVCNENICDELSVCISQNNIENISKKQEEHFGKADIHEETSTTRKMRFNVNPLQCQYCDKVFSYKSKLVIHVRTHTDEKPYHCSICGRDFALLHHLQKHELIHSGEKPYVCAECNKGFTNTSDLKAHQRVHTGARPYICDVCYKSFAQRSNLNTHKRLHTGARPYTCDLCAKTFTQSSDLITHTRSHTGEKPYKCDRCGSMFARSTDLKKHRRMHTGERPYKCDICSKAFTQCSSLKAHKGIHLREAAQAKS